MKSLVTLIKDWSKDIYSTLFSKDGWRLFAKSITLLVTLIGVLYANMIFQSGRLEAKRIIANELFYNYCSNLGSSESKTARINAMLMTPTVMNFHAPINTDLNVFKALWITLGIINIEYPIYHIDVKKRFFEYVKSIDGKDNITSQEISIIIETLEKIGAAGWYNLNPLELEKQNYRERINWIWNKPDIKRFSNKVKINDIFQGLNLDKQKFKELNINNGNLSNTSNRYTEYINCSIQNTNYSNSSYYEALFKNVTLNNVIYKNAAVHKSIFEFVRISGDFNDFNNGKILNTNFYNCEFNNIYFDLKSTFYYNYFYKVKHRNVYYRDANIYSTKYSNCVFINSSYHNSYLRDCIFILDSFYNVDFTNIEIENTFFYSCFFDSLSVMDSTYNLYIKDIGHEYE
jgi:uncharacterized protein YjbI with pentapeptide repeats